MEDWAEIRRLHRAEGLPIKLIARTLGVSRNTVRAAIASDGPPRYERKPTGSAVDGFDRAIQEQLMVAEDAGHGDRRAGRLDAWDDGVQGAGRGAATGLSAAGPDLADRYVAGEIAQCDLWFPPVSVPVGFGRIRTPAQLRVLTMVTGYSRWLAAHGSLLQWRPERHRKGARVPRLLCDVVGCRKAVGD